MKETLTIEKALERGIQAFKAGNLKKADNIFTAILKTEPDNAHANYNMGLLALTVGKVKEALPFLQSACENSPSTKKFWLKYIDSLIIQSK